MEKKIKKNLIFNILYASFFLLIILFSTIFNWLQPVDNFFMDKMYQHSSTVDTNIKIIAIDDKSLEKLGPLIDWNRGYYASLVEKLNSDDHKPAVIGFDILFTGNTNSENDKLFADTCRDAQNVLVGMNVIFGDKIYEEDNESFQESTIVDISYPYDELKPYVKTGFVNAIEDSNDSKVRKCITSLEKNGNTYDSFSYALYKEYMSYYNKDFNTYDSNKAYRFKYSSLPNKLYSVISFSDVIDGTIPLSDFEGALVLVGAYTTGLQDQYYTPMTSSDKMNGVEIHANMIDAYLKDDLLTDVNVVLEVLINTIIIATIAFVFSFLPLLKSSIISASSISLLLLLQTLLDKVKIYYPLTTVAIFIFIIYLISILKHYIEEKKSKKAIMNAFKKYVAPQVVDKAIKDGTFSMNLGGEKKNIACLFVDIRGFTPLSEKLNPMNVIEILNEYLSLTTKAIFKNGGTLDKFIGDATMAIFNAPFDLDDYAFKAVLTAWDIAKESKKIEDLFMEKFDCKVSYGIGVNLGDAVIGNIGCDFRMDYTAIGDTVNTAARLESNAKAGEILISEALYEVVKDRIDAICIGGLKMKGKSTEVITYKVTGIKEVEE